MRFLRQSLVGIFLLSLTVGLLAWAGNMFYNALQIRLAEGNQARPPRERIFAANVVQVQAQTIEPLLVSFGEVRSRRTLDLRATVGGTIVSLADQFEEGGNVTAGQLLVQIDPTDAQSALVLARTDVAEAGAEKRDAERGLELARDELDAALDQVRLRDLALTRQKDLLARGAGTASAVENSELSVSSAKQAVLSRRQGLANTQARIDQANTALARHIINQSEAERALADTRLYAGFAGTLSQVSAVEGGLVTNNERLGQIVDARALEVSFRVSTAQYIRLLDKDGTLLPAEVMISVDVFGVDLTTKGFITRESAVVGDGQTGRLLFAQIKDAKGFRPGDFVTVNIHEPALDNVVKLPALAIDARPSVLALGPADRLQSIDVTLLRRQGNDVIVRAAALDGREIVTERSALLGVGIKVRPIRPQTAGVAARAVEAGAEMVALSPERRAKLVAFIQSNKRMPADAKKRVLGQLNQEKVPRNVVDRLEKRIGG